MRAEPSVSGLGMVGLGFRFGLWQCRGRPHHHLIIRCARFGFREMSGVVTGQRVLDGVWRGWVGRPER